MARCRGSRYGGHPVMPKPRILVVEDDPRTASSIALYLRHGGYDVVVAGTGPDALTEAVRQPPDLLVLDVMLPGLDGFEVCRALRQRSAVPVIMLTARSTEDDTIGGFRAGADDYVTKPFSPRELVARVDAVLRRARPSARLIEVGGVAIDLEQRTVRRRGRRVSLTATEFKLLEALASSPGRTFSRAELGERAFGYEYTALDRTIDAHVMNLRRKIEPDRSRPSVVVTVFGTGYRLGDADGD
jgi:DNA-binding response OmpR family regulator